VAFVTYLIARVTLSANNPMARLSPAVLIDTVNNNQ